MLVAEVILMRETIDAVTIGDVCRSLIAGAATLLLFRLLPAFTPFLAIPMCVLVFGGLSMLFGAVRRSDVEILIASLRRPAPIPAPAGDDLDPPAPPVSAMFDSSSDRAR
jgi:hypothetical protein